MQDLGFRSSRYDGERLPPVASEHDAKSSKQLVATSHFPRGPEQLKLFKGSPSSVRLFK